jgi:DNA-binding GntR family transcriptional regulator
MPLRQISLPSRQSIAQELYIYLRGAILSGELRPYERLVENHIAELAAVSRTPVREALHRLEVSGLVRESERGGVEVCGFSLNELADLCAVRETLEAMASGLAATSRSDMDLAMLKQIAKAEERAIGEGGSPDIHVSLNHSFHETLWHASRNRYLTSQLQGLRELIEGLQMTTLQSVERQTDAVKEHLAIVDAVERRAADEAADLARIHFRNALTTRLVMNAEHIAERPDARDRAR